MRLIAVVLLALVAISSASAGRSSVVADQRLGDLVKQLPLLSQNQKVNCETDGNEGRRVVAVYLYPDGQSDDEANHTADIDQTLSKVDEVWDAAADPYDQHPRWACTPDDGRPVIIASRGPAVGGDGAYTFTDVRTALQQEGLTSPDRVYVVFADHIGEFPYYGQATVDADDRPDQSNLNNTGPAYAMIDAQAVDWSSGSMWQTALHELGHALGAVQCTAPHSSCPAGELYRNHCYDGTDIMCYNDGGSYFRGPDGISGTADDGSMQNVCDSNASNDTHWDCGRDDYFNVDPPPGSYLATHWNLARSAFVTPLRSE